MYLAVTESNIFVSAKTVELAEHPDYLELVNRVCFYDAPNHNSVELDFDDNSLEKAETLVHMPVVAKYCVDRDGKPTFKGHEVSKTKDGYKFGTKAIGTHTSVEIKEDEVIMVDGTKRKLPCLFATQRIWTRFENATNAVKRLFNEDRLHNSWELKSSEYTYKNGIKHITDYKFIGNCFLGLAEPAYGKSAKVISVASSEDGEFLIAEALAMDIASEPASNNYDSDGKEEVEEMENFEIEIVEQSEIAAEAPESVESVEVDVSEEEVSEEVETVEVSDESEGEAEVSAEEEVSETENSSMPTAEDIRRMLCEALHSHKNDEYPYMEISMIFPEDHIVLAKHWRMKTLQFAKFDYRIEGEVAVLENEEMIELIVSPIAINAEIDKKNEAILKSEKLIEEQKSQIAELCKAKEELASIKNEQAMSELRKYAIDSKCFTVEEISEGEIAEKICALDKAWIKNEIADRVVANRNKELSETEVSEITESAKADSFSIVLSDKETVVTSEDVMRSFFEK